MSFKLTALGAAMMVVLASSVAAQELTQQQRQNYMMAVMVEWVVANCDAPRVSAMYFNMAYMTLNGGYSEALDAMRDEFRNGVAENYSGIDAACTDLLPRVASK